jgi:hypothetical protein
VSNIRDNVYWAVMKRNFAREGVD